MLLSATLRSPGSMRASMPGHVGPCSGFGLTDKDSIADAVTKIDAPRNWLWSPPGYGIMPRGIFSPER
ncbi:hypothetical protein MSKU3_1501 [Komagataeibacter oboediens]|nr:hypothetical protein MSKU3_1501 [Komagataeibacter oboediens]